MYDDDDDIEVVFEGRPMPGHRFRWLNLGIVTLSAVSGWIDDVAELLMQHVNYGVQQKQMHTEAAAEIERLVNGE